MANQYIDPNKTRYVHLVDGGVSDNLALRAGGSTLQTATREQVVARGFASVRRILVISVDGQGAQDAALAQQKIVLGLFRSIMQASGAQIDRYNFETLIAVTQQLNTFAETVKAARCAQAPVINGAACGDVKASLVHVSLQQMPEGPNKEKLLAIPTGLTIPREDVDLLVQAGHDAIVNSPELRGFLEDYPPAPVPPVRPAARRRVAAR